MKKIKQFAVFGLGKFGQSVARTLSEAGYEVLAVDQDERIIDEVSEFVTHAVQADVTDIDALRSLGIRNFDVAVIAIGAEHMQSSIMATLLAKEVGVKYVLAKAQDDMHKKILERIGADRVVFPEREMGIRIGTNLMAGNIIDYIEVSPDYSIVEIEMVDDWVGKSLKELNMRAVYGLTVMAIRHDNDIDIAPPADVPLHEDDVLVVIASNDDLHKFDVRKQKR